MGNICNRQSEEEAAFVKSFKNKPCKLRVEMEPDSSEGEEESPGKKMSDLLLEQRKSSRTPTFVVNKLLTYKDLRGFKKIKDIKELYRWEK